MCGIAGLFRPAGLAPDDVGAVERMTAAQRHRGPAARGLFSDGRVALGHRRLSIIDLAAAANQPMGNEDGTIRVTYNGEIYNYRELRSQLVERGHCFRSHSDTEVIVHGYEEWGIERLLEQLRGMFAFGLYDSRRGLLLARDRLGIKPLYYYESSHAGMLLFASEVKALLTSRLVPNVRDMRAVAGFLLTGSVPAPATIVKGVSSLPAGHYLAVRDSGMRIRKYWELNTFAPGVSADIGHVRALLQDSVSRHLMSDVPLGVFLSAGVDSGALVAFASRAMTSSSDPADRIPDSVAQPFRAADDGVVQAFRPAHPIAPAHRLKTLTVVFDEQQFSEGSEAAAVGRRFGTDHQEIRITRSEFIGELPKIFAAMDQPTHDGVNTYFISRAARQAGLTVVLSGLGGDEVFWGYRHYRWLNGHAAWLTDCPSALRQMMTRAAAFVGRARGRENLMRMDFLQSGASSREVYLMLRGFFPPRHVMRLLDVDRRDVDGIVQQHFEPESVVDKAAPASAFNRIEFKRYLHDQLLRDTDVFGMAHSIEVRVPLLDHAIVEYAASLSPAAKTANRVNKPLLVGAVDDPLLFKAGAAKKKGFSFPMDSWMKDSANDLEDLAVGGDVLNRDAVRSLWKDFRAGHLHWSRAWALTVLGATNREASRVTRPSAIAFTAGSPVLMRPA
jgi:asparagine synthase (glutamine-hydrolysing)